MESKGVMELIKEKGIRMIDLRFMDLPGLWQHFSVPVDVFTEDVFTEGLGFDGSSIRGWRSIHESDMIVVPDAASAFIDPFFVQPTLTLICDILDPVTRESYTRDPQKYRQQGPELPHFNGHRRQGLLRLRGRVLHLR